MISARSSLYLRESARLFAHRLRQDKGHRLEWEAFSQAIITGSAPPIPYEQLFGVTEATFAALEALRTRQPVSWLITTS